MIHDNLYITPPADHWIFQNRHRWSADEVTEFLEEHCGGDVMRPCGAQLLMLEPVAEEKKTKAGIIILEGLDDEKIKQTSLARVLDFGPDAYQDLNRFPSGPYCQRGDWVIYYKYERRKTRIHVPVSLDIDRRGYKEYDLINCFDDKILNIVKDPSFVDGTPIA